MFLNKLSISAKLLALLSLVFIGAFAMALIAYVNLSSMKKSLDTIYFGNLVPVIELQSMLLTYSDDVVSIVYKTKSGLIEPREALNHLRSAQNSALLNWQSYKKIYKNRYELKYIQYADKMVTDINSYLSDLIAVYAKNERSLAASISTRTLFSNIERIKNTIGKIIIYEIEIAKSERKIVIATYENTIKQLIVLLVGITLFAVLIAIPIMGNIRSSQLNLESVKEKLKESNRELLGASITDSLTGVYNRRYFDEIMHKEFQRSIRERKQLTFLLLDVDHFKNYNDTYGHPAGDEALKKIASTLQESAKRASDFVFRMGGEEFAVLMIDNVNKKSDESVIQVAGKILDGVEGLKIKHENSSVADVVTVSIGIYTEPPRFGDSEEVWFKNADAALYKAKESGRNTLRIFKNEDSNENETII